MLRWHLWRSRSSSASTRCAAAPRLGRLPGRAASERLIDLLKDLEAREAAVIALRATRDPSATGPLMDAAWGGKGRATPNQMGAG